MRSLLIFVKGLPGPIQVVDKDMDIDELTYDLRIGGEYVKHPDSENGEEEQAYSILVRIIPVIQTDNPQIRSVVQYINTKDIMMLQEMEISEIQIASSLPTKGPTILQ